MSHDVSDMLCAAFGLMLVAEGILPLLAPQAWRESFQRLLRLKNGQIRFVGLAAFLAGLLLVLSATR